MHNVIQLRLVKQVSNPNSFKPMKAFPTLRLHSAACTYMLILNSPLPILLSPYKVHTQALFYLHQLLTLIKGVGPLPTLSNPFAPPFQTASPTTPHSQPTTEQTTVKKLSKSSSTHHLTPPYPFSIIPNVKTVGDAVAQWLHPNLPSLPVALKDWEKAWITGKWKEVHGMKYCGWRTIGEAYVS